LRNDDHDKVPAPRSTTSTAAAPAAHTESVGDGQESRDGIRDETKTTTTARGTTTFRQQVHELRRKVGAFVNHEKVQILIILLISINGIMMGIATFNFVEDNEKVSKAFDTVDNIFLYIFTVELFLQFVYHGLKLFLDGWLVFDFVIIILSFTLASVQVIRAFRIFRALRLVTRIKALRNLVEAMFDVMPRMAAIWGLLGLMFYIFAVMFTQLFNDLQYAEYNYFVRLDNSFFSLFQIMTLDAWADVSRQVVEEYKFAWLPILMFVIISAFVVVNLIIAVLCEAISTLEGEEKARIMGGGDVGGGESEEENASINNNKATAHEVMLAEELATLKERFDQMEEMHRQTTKAIVFLTQQLKSRQFHFESSSSIDAEYNNNDTSTSSFDC